MGKQTIPVSGNISSDIVAKANIMFGDVYDSALRKWEGKKVSSYGDSIVAGNTWQPTVMSLLGITSHYLRGVGSSRIADTNYSAEYVEKMTFYANSDGSYNNRPTRFGGTVDVAPEGTTEIFANLVTQNRIDTIPLDTELLIILGGANDAGTVAIGTIGDAENETETFYGAYKLMLNRINTRVPSAKIAILGMPFHKTADSITTLTGNYQLFRDAIKEISYVYGYPYVDLREKCGWNTLNASTFLQDNVHPNATGGKRIGAVIAQELLKMIPI